MPAPPTVGALLRRPYLLLALLTLAAFADAVPNGFVWIDHWQIAGGGLIATSWPALWRSFHEPLGAMPGWQGTAPYARPAVVALLSLTHWLGGLHAWAYHLTLVLLHVANVLLAYSLLCTLTVPAPLALLATALFAVHPLQTAAVSWISGIADPLCTVFVLAALRLQLAARKRSGTAARGLRLIAIVCAALALGAKETAAVLPALLAGVYFLLPAAVDAPAALRPRLRAMGGATTPFVAVVAADAAYRFAVLKGAALGSGFGTVALAVRLHTLPRLLLSYVTLPLRLGALTVCDDFRLSTSWDFASLLAVLGLAAVAGIGVVAYRRAPYLAFGLFWMVVTLLPALNLVPILHYRADRFFYLPMLGWSLAALVLLRAAGGLVRRAVGRLPTLSATAAPLLAVALVILLAVVTARRNRLFANDLTLFEATVSESPYCREAHTTLGDAYLRLGRAGAAVGEYTRALQDDPNRASYVVIPKVLINLGMAQLERGDYADARTAFRAAHRLQPGLLHPLFGLGIANLGLGDAAIAAGWLERAAALAPNDPDVVFNLALSYDRSGRRQAARRTYRHYLDVGPAGRARRFAQQRLQALDAGGG